MPQNEVPIFGGEAIIYTNDFEVWQFRCWISSEGKYVRKSLRTKIRSDAIELAKKEYLAIEYARQNDKKLFGVSIVEAADAFLANKGKQVGRQIVAGRLATIKAHLQHFLDYVGVGTKLQNISKRCLKSFEIDGEELDYVTYRMDEGASESTVRNEVSTIKMLFKWLYEEDYTDFPSLQQPDLAYSQHNVDRELVRRQTFTKTEYQQFYVKARTYVARSHNKKISDEEMLWRELVRDYFLFAANSGMRSGELRQMTWENIAYRSGVVGDKTVELVMIHVPARTTKVRTERTFMCAGKQFLERWAEVSGRRQGLVFSIDGVSEIANSTIVRHFNRILKLTDIPKERQKQLVPYSFRHYCVSRMVLDNGLSFERVAMALGTSVKQIERTYLHLNEEAMFKTGAARFQSKSGDIVMFDAGTDDAL